MSRNSPSALFLADGSIELVNFDQIKSSVSNAKSQRRAESESLPSVRINFEKLNEFLNLPSQLDHLRVEWFRMTKSILLNKQPISVTIENLDMASPNNVKNLKSILGILNSAAIEDFTIMNSSIGEKQMRLLVKEVIATLSIRNLRLVRNNYHEGAEQILVDCIETSPDLILREFQLTNFPDELTNKIFKILIASGNLIKLNLPSIFLDDETQRILCIAIKDQPFLSEIEFRRFNQLSEESKQKFKQDVREAAIVGYLVREELGEKGFECNFFRDEITPRDALSCNLNLVYEAKEIVERIKAEKGITAQPDSELNFREEGILSNLLKMYPDNNPAPKREKITQLDEKEDDRYK